MPDSSYRSRCVMKLFSSKLSAGKLWREQAVREERRRRAEERRRRKRKREREKEKETKKEKKRKRKKERAKEKEQKKKTKREREKEKKRKREREKERKRKREEEKKRKREKEKKRKREKEKKRKRERKREKDGWIHCNGESTSAKRTTLKNLGYTFASGLWQNAGIEYRCLAQRPRTPSEEKWGHLNHSGWTRRDRVLSSNHNASAAQ